MRKVTARWMTWMVFGSDWIRIDRGSEIRHTRHGEFLAANGRIFPSLREASDDEAIPGNAA